MLFTVSDRGVHFKRDPASGSKFTTHGLADEDLFAVARGYGIELVVKVNGIDATHIPLPGRNWRKDCKRRKWTYVSESRRFFVASD